MVKTMVIGLLTFALLLTGFTLVTLAQSVTAFVDQNPIPVTETVQFTIRWSGPNPGTSINLDLLRKDFDVLGTSQSNRSSIINGRTEMTTEWISTLSPKRAGKLLIPAIPVGPYQTPPITLTVLAQPEPAHDEDSLDFFLETSIEPQDPYLQSQVTYTIRLYHAIPLREGHIEDPTLPNAMIARIGEDVEFEAVKDGRRYRVVERKFSIIPQKSGTLTIPPATFKGKVPLKKGRRSLLDDLFNNQLRSFGKDPFSTIFQHTKPIISRSKANTLHVQPIPESMKDDVWLPAKELSLSEDWLPDPGQAQTEFRVGEPMTRTIVLRAKGLMGTQLPDFASAGHSQLKVYPDRPKIDTQFEGTLPVGSREQKLALVPLEAGKLQLSEVRIPWWDVDQHKRRIAILPSRTLTILPESGKRPVPVSPTPQPHTEGDPGPGESIPSTNKSLFVEENGDHTSMTFPLIWPTIAGVLFLGWILTGVGWFYDRKKALRISKSHKGGSDLDLQSQKKLLKAFQTACNENNPKKARSALLHLAQSKWQHSHITGLGDIARRAKDPEAQAAIWDLDRSLYAVEQPPWDGKNFYHLVAYILDETKPVKVTENDRLAPLYLTKV